MAKLAPKIFGHDRHFWTYLDSARKRYNRIARKGEEIEEVETFALRLAVEMARECGLDVGEMPVNPFPPSPPREREPWES